MNSYYDNIDKACKERGTTITQVLREIGKSKSSGSSWKRGSVPSLDVCDGMAKRLGISIDELVNGEPFDESQRTKPTEKVLNTPRDEVEWMNLYHQIPEGKRYAVKTFLMQMVPESAPGLNVTEGDGSYAS